MSKKNHAKSKVDREAAKRAEAQHAKELIKQRKAEKAKQGDRQP